MQNRSKFLDVEVSHEVLFLQHHPQTQSNQIKEVVHGSGDFTENKALRAGWVANSEFKVF